MKLEFFNYQNNVSLSIRCNKQDVLKYRIEIEKLARLFFPQEFMQSLTIHEFNYADNTVVLMYEYQPLVES